MPAYQWLFSRASPRLTRTLDYSRHLFLVTSPLPSSRLPVRVTRPLVLYKWAIPTAYLFALPTAGVPWRGFTRNLKMTVR